MQREKRKLKSVFSTNLIATILRLRMLQHPKTGDLNNPKPLHKWQLTTCQILVWKTLQMHNRTLKYFEAKKYAEGKKKSKHLTENAKLNQVQRWRCQRHICITLKPFYERMRTRVSTASLKPVSGKCKLQQMSCVFARHGIISDSQKQVNIQLFGFQCEHECLKILSSSTLRMFSDKVHLRYQPPIIYIYFSLKKNLLMCKWKIKLEAEVYPNKPSKDTCKNQQGLGRWHPSQL